MGQEISQDIQIMERQLAKPKHILQIPAGDKKTYLHDECDRRIQQTAEESDQSKVSISNRRQPLQNVIPCYDRYNEKMDRTPRRLGKDTRSTVHILRGKDGGIGEKHPNIKIPSLTLLTSGSGAVMVSMCWCETVKMTCQDTPNL